MNPSNPSPEAQRSARRRLVRGAFAAPAVLALYSGSAAAMASNLRCVNNQVGAKVFPGAEDTQDRYVRVQLWSQSHNGEVRWFLRGTDFQALTMGRTSVGNTFLRNGQWWQFNPNTQRLVSNMLSAQPQGTQPVRNGKWVAVRIDATPQGATIVGVVEHTNSVGSAVSGLCWASFVTAAR